MSMTTLVLFLTAVTSLSFSRTALAASAVAFDRETSTYAYVHSAQNEEEAKARALDSCHKRNGRSCQVIASCTGGGYGAISMRRLPGKPIEAIGVSCGAGNPEEANNLASQECNRHLTSSRCGRPTVGWHDTVQKK